MKDKSNNNFIIYLITRRFFNELISYYTHLDISKFHFMNNEDPSNNSYVN